jgi:sulfate permease, SulP family
VLIISTQVKDFLGLEMSEVPSEFIARIAAYVSAIATIDGLTVAFGIVSLAVIIVSPRILRKVPGQIVALFLATAVVGLFNLPIETVGTRFGGIPSTLPEWRVPQFRGRLDPSGVTIGAHRGDSRRGREPAVRRRGR